MEMKIMWFGAIFFGGWLWSYLFVRQFLFNLKVALPLIKGMKSVDKELIAPGADKYTSISFIICSFFILLPCILICLFCPTYLMFGFFIGFITAGVMVGLNAKPSNRSMFDSFCVTYYRFVPDDALRTAMYNKKPSQMKLRLHDMNLSTAFIPAFGKED